ncbi:MAG: DUF3352 domain-containing protein [Bacteroidales bacterium]|nr:DUF3352 domain-containing protein [Bacteroidales bacterium]
MKKATKIFLISLTAIIITVGAVATYFYFKTSPKRDIWNYVPNDAVYIIETDNLTKGWNKLSDSKMWKHLISDPLFNSIQESALMLDSLIKDNETLDMLFKNRPLLISCHLLPKKDFDFLFLVDLKQAGKFAFIKNYIGGIVSFYGYDMGREKFEDTELLIISDKSSDDVFYISIIDNVFMVSYNKNIVQNAIINAQKQSYIENDKNFKIVSATINDNKLFRIYANYDFLSTYIGYYLSDSQDLLSELKRIFAWSAFDIELDDEILHFKGSTILKDSARSYIEMLSRIEKGPIEAYKIIPSDFALYLSISFADYMDLFTNLKNEFKFSDASNSESYEKTLKRVEKMFNINLEEDFFSWIGTEIALLKLPPTPNSREYDILTIIHTKDIEKAINGLNKITNKIKNRTPIKIKENEYKNFKIYYFGLNGFFRMFFGKMFAKLEKPYYIFMEEFVVFSNSPSCLLDMIDAYEKGRILENNSEFKTFLKQFDDEANISIFMQGPKIYSHLYYYAKPEQKNNIKQSREILSSFQNIGFQLVSKKQNLFENKLIVVHNADALYESELEDIENSAEDLYIAEFDSLLEIEKPEKYEDGKTCKIYWDEDSTQIKAEGRIIKDKREGMWRYYYENGNIWGSLMFEKDEPTGKGTLYHDKKESTSKAQATFEDGKIEGTYLEFYTNNEPKSNIKFKDGEPNGEAKFFYDSGNIKIEGEYKDGMKKGKWKHYTETGDLMNKEKWKKDIQKK